MATNHQQVMCDRKVLIDRGIEQAWHRRLLNSIHAGVHVKIRNVPLQKLIEYRAKMKMNDIAIQTVPIQYVHRHTSYEFIHSSSSQSESHDENSTTSQITSSSTHTSSSSIASINDQKTKTMHRTYPQYPNRNNHALNSDQISEKQERQRQRHLFTPFLQLFSLFRFQAWISKSRCRRSINRYRPTPTASVKINDDLLVKSISSAVPQVLHMTNNASVSSDRRRRSRPIMDEQSPSMDKPIHLRVKNRHILSDLSRFIASDYHEHQNIVKDQKSNNYLASPQERLLHSTHSHLQEKTNPIIENGIELLHRYQQYAQGYQLKSDPAVKKFLFESVALSAEALH